MSLTEAELENTVTGRVIRRRIFELRNKFNNKILSKRICVIGGGFAGLACMKSLLEENLEPVCFEKSPRVGGTWNYLDEAEDGIGSTMSTTTINHSKEMGSLSDIMFPEDAPNYLRHWEVLQYFMSLVEALDLFKYITCNREVTMVAKASDYEESGRWLVTVKDTQNGEIKSEIFDGVLVCTGHISHPNMPKYPGMEEFRGTMMHTHDLKTSSMFDKCKVAVIGTGCSGLDAATSISNVAKQVYLSMRTPSWIISRIGPYGIPIDYALLRRWFVFFQSILPIDWVSRFVETNVLDRKFSHSMYGIKPKYPLLCKEPSVNDDIAPRIITGSIAIRRDVKAFQENGLMFEGEDKVTEVDAVIFGTGYTWKYPFLEKGTIEVIGDKINLYKCMYPAHLKHPTLAVIGFILPLGPGFPIGELQCRWAVRLLSSKCHLPNIEDMKKDVERRYSKNKERFPPTEKISVRVDFIQYMDEIATQFGVKPNFWKMLFTDPILFKACVFGPCLPYQYRLEGPHKWEGARKAILTAPERMKAPFRRHCENEQREDESTRKVASYMTSFCIIALMVSLKCFYFKYLFLALIIPYYFSIRTVARKYILALLLLPFYAPWDGFVFDYIVTIYGSLAIAVTASLI